MSYAAIVAGVGALAGVGGNMLGTRAAKKAARRQADLARAQAKKIRDRAAEAALASKQEIETLRTIRSLDLPAFRQASETALLQAQKGAERMARQRTMGRLAPDIRQAIFGGQFQQYVGREIQRLTAYAGLTQQILSATERQQEQALRVEAQASQLEYEGQSAALQAEAAAGDETAQLLTAVGAALSQYGGAMGAKQEAAKAGKQAFAQDLMLQEFGKTGKSAEFFSNGKFDWTKFNAMWDQSPMGPGGQQ